MNYSCPKCGVDIVLHTKKESVRRKYASVASIAIDSLNIDKCPNCGIKVYKAPHPFKKAAEAALFLPIIVFLAGLIMQNGWVLVAGGKFFVIVVLFIVRNIKTNDYKSWKYFRAR